MASNQAGFLDEKGARIRVGEAEMPKAAAGTIIVRNKAIAINPVDWKIQDTGMFVKNYPIVLGEDVCGEVVEVGEGVKTFKKGDRVTSHVLSLLTQQSKDGAFALYSSASADKSCVIPDSITFAEGSVLPLAFDTAAVGLYLPASDGYLGLPFPSHQPKSAGKTIVVWGGSSSVGALTIQLAVASGVKVVATASKHNFDLCKKWGASEVIDYRSPSVADDVVSAVKNLGGDFAGVYDAISLEDSVKASYAIIEKFGGGNLAVVLPPDGKNPASVKVGHVFGINDVTHELWANFLPKALESGQIKAVPEPLVIGKGLESVQKGMDENKKGVSARKVVIEL